MTDWILIMFIWQLVGAVSFVWICWNTRFEPTHVPIWVSVAAILAGPIGLLVVVAEMVGHQIERWLQRRDERKRIPRMRAKR